VIKYKVDSMMLLCELFNMATDIITVLRSPALPVIKPQGSRLQLLLD